MAAIPRNMTGMAIKMSAAGYKTHMFGKWDAGMGPIQSGKPHTTNAVLSRACLGKLINLI